MTSASLSKTHGLFSIPEIKALKRIIRTLPKHSTAVVVGAGPGTMTMAILEARDDITVHSVDNVTAKSEKAHAIAGGHGDRLYQIKGDSREVGLAWGAPIDILLIDAWHTYESVKGDTSAWLPHLKDGGIVWFHDYGTSNSMYLDVKRAVDEDMVGMEKVAQVNASIAFRWVK